MGLRILIVLFIALPFVIYGEKAPTKFVNEVMVLKEYAQNGTMIADKALILTENGFLGEGDVGFVYAGQLTENLQSVAIKFIPKRNAADAQNEYKIFKQLQADTKPEVELLGIPSLHYYGEWKSFILIAITKLHESLRDVKETKFIYAIDIMILFRNFVVQSRYMHRHRVFHGDLHFNNIMIRFHQSFIIDFSKAQIMEEENKYVLAHRDWINFMNTILGICNIEISGSWDDFKSELSKKITDTELVSVINRFGDEAFSTIHSEQPPDYDGLEEFIKKEVIKHGRKTGSLLMFTWFANR